MIQGVIFDMDGLMFDTERLWMTFWRPALADLGLEYSEGLAEDARGTAGQAMLDVLHKHYGKNCDAHAIHDSLHRVAEKVFMSTVVPKKPGLDELVQYLTEQHIPMAVASSSQEFLVRHHLQAHNMEQYFSVIISGGMVQRSKPNPDIFLATAEKLGVSPANCLVLEDSYNGVRAGHAGGFITVMVPDLAPANEEMRSLYTCEKPDLFAVKAALQVGEL